MPLVLPKKDATQEELNAWLVETQEKYNQLETDNEKKTARETELINYNNKLFAKITGQKEGTKEDPKDNEEIPSCIDKEMYEKLSEKDKKELNELLEEDEE